MKAIIVLVACCSVGCVGVLGDFSSAPTSKDSVPSLHDDAGEVLDGGSEASPPPLECVVIHAAWMSNNTFATSAPAVCPAGMLATECNADTSGFGVVPVITPANSDGGYATGDVPTECLVAIGAGDGGPGYGSIAAIALCCNQTP